jgi:hypothetical protein
MLKYVALLCCCLAAAAAFGQGVQPADTSRQIPARSEAKFIHAIDKKTDKFTSALPIKQQKRWRNSPNGKIKFTTFYKRLTPKQQPGCLTTN